MLFFTLFPLLTKHRMVTKAHTSQKGCFRKEGCGWKNYQWTSALNWFLRFCSAKKGGVTQKSPKIEAQRWGYKIGLAKNRVPHACLTCKITKKIKVTLIKHRTIYYFSLPDRKALSTQLTGNETQLQTRAPTLFRGCQTGFKRVNGWIGTFGGEESMSQAPALTTTPALIFSSLLLCCPSLVLWFANRRAVNFRGLPSGVENPCGRTKKNELNRGKDYWTSWNRKVGHFYGTVSAATGGRGNYPCGWQLG